MSNKQKIAIAFIERNPGCCVMDLNRYEFGGRGHAATYLRVDRLIKNGAIVSRKGKGNRCALYVRGAAPPKTPVVG